MWLKKKNDNHVFLINVGDLFSCIKVKASHMISMLFQFTIFVVSLVTLLAVFSSFKCAILVGKHENLKLKWVKNYGKARSACDDASLYILKGFRKLAMT